MKYYYLKRYPNTYYYLQHGTKKYGFRYTYYDNRHRRHEKSKRGFSNLQGAIKGVLKARQRHQKLTSSHNLTFGQWCKYYLQMKKASTRKITTYLSYAHLLRNNVLPQLSNVHLIDIKPLSYKYKCLMHLFQQGLSRRTVIDVNKRVQTVMNSAVKEGLINRNPLKGITVPKFNQRPKKEIMNHRQLKHFDKVLNHHSLQYQVIFYTLQGTGMRCGELMGLHWRDVNLLKRLIHIKYTRDNYGLRPPKTEASDRLIKISSSLDKLLAKYYQDCHKKFNTGADSLVILGKHGKPFTPNMVSPILKHLLIESGMKKLVGRFTAHSFRHQLISQLIDAGVRPIAVSQMMGHSSVRTTLDIYAQSAPGEILDMDKALQKIKR